MAAKVTNQIRKITRLARDILTNGTDQEKRVLAAINEYRRKANSELAEHGIPEANQTECTTEIFSQIVSYYERAGDKGKPIMSDIEEDTFFNAMADSLRKRGITDETKIEDILIKMIDLYCEMKV